MRILIDTNIFIFRENYAVLPENLQALLGLLNRAGIDIVLHPLSLEEIQRDSNSERKEIVLSKIKTYQMIEQPPLIQDDVGFSNLVGKPADKNELVDDNLLYCVFRDTVDFLVSEDKGIQSKSKRIGLSHRVLTVDQAIGYFKSRFRVNPITSPPALREVPVYRLSLDDPIFDSLKIEYAKTRVHFGEWWSKICREGRKAWVYQRDDGPLGAILIYKIEDEPVWSNPPLPPKKRLKINTMKVAPTETGQKIGELFIKMSVDFSIRNRIYEIYLTHFTRPSDELVQLIEEFGFCKIAEIEGEDVYVKSLIPEGSWTSPFDVSKKFYPSFYDGKLVKKFVVPILPKYHDSLFTDYHHRQPTMLEFSGQFIVEGNTIKKAYLSHSKVRGMGAGDILLFYRSQDERSVVTLGVVESVHHSQNSSRILELVSRRTVYPFEEIRRFARKPTIVILFRAHFHITHPLKLNYLLSHRILPQAPRSIVKISHNRYMEMKAEGEIDERFTVN